MPHRFTRGPRPLARQFALLALYEWQMTGKARDELDASLMTLAGEAVDKDDFARCDKTYYAELVDGIIADATTLFETIGKALDRELSRISYVERAVLLIAAYELANRKEIPYRVVINEAVELAKVFGGNDGYKYVNGVLDRLSKILRPEADA